MRLQHLASTACIYWTCQVNDFCTYQANECLYILGNMAFLAVPWRFQVLAAHPYHLQSFHVFLRSTVAGPQGTSHWCAKPLRPWFGCSNVSKKCNIIAYQVLRKTLLQSVTNRSRLYSLHKSTPCYKPPFSRDAIDATEIAMGSACSLPGSYPNQGWARQIGKNHGGSA